MNIEYYMNDVSSGETGGEAGGENKPEGGAVAKAIAKLRATPKINYPGIRRYEVVCGSAQNQ